jgi:hypothetical protein
MIWPGDMKSCARRKSLPRIGLNVARPLLSHVGVIIARQSGITHVLAAGDAIKCEGEQKLLKNYWEKSTNDFIDM